EAADAATTIVTAASETRTHRFVMFPLTRPTCGPKACPPGWHYTQFLAVWRADVARSPAFPVGKSRQQLPCELRDQGTSHRGTRAGLLSPASTGLLRCVPGSTHFGAPSQGRSERFAPRKRRREAIHRRCRPFRIERRRRSGSAREEETRIDIGGRGAIDPGLKAGWAPPPRSDDSAPPACPRRVGHPARPPCNARCR